jgi:hypothetical protein
MNNERAVRNFLSRKIEKIFLFQQGVKNKNFLIIEKFRLFGGLNYEL